MGAGSLEMYLVVGLYNVRGVLVQVVPGAL